MDREIKLVKLVKFVKLVKLGKLVTLYGKQCEIRFCIEIEPKCRFTSLVFDTWILSVGAIGPPYPRASWQKVGAGFVRENTPMG